MRKMRLRLLDDLRGVEMYVAVAEAGGITRAARRLSVLPSTVSKKIAELEGRAKIRLFHRTTRSIRMTDAGKRFYEQCLRLLSEAERAEWELRDEVQDPVGRICVTTPVVFAQRQISPLLPDFLGRYPNIELELVASARILNLVEEGFDLSIRLARVDQVGRADRLLAKNRRVVCASDAYIERYGVPNQPADLLHHRCLVSKTSQKSDLWRFLGGDKDAVESVRVKGPLVSDNAATLAEAAVQGIGIAMLGTFVVGDYLRRGLLKELLPGRLLQDSVFVGVTPEHTLIPYRVGLFIEYLVERFGDPPIWDMGLVLGEAQR